MGMKLKMIMCLSIISHLSLGQVVLKGHVFNSKSKEAIRYANIGILNTKTGTISNADGSYEIVVPDSLSSRQIIFSAIGYKRQQLSITRLMRQVDVKLKPTATRLKNVDIIANRKTSKKWLGNKRKALFLSGSMNYDSASAGAAKAILIKRKVGLKYVKEAQLLIAGNTLPEFKIRVRLLKKDKLTNLPADDILHESVIVTSDIRKGWITFDLAEHNIMIEDEEFFLAFEWLYEKKDRMRIAKAYADFMRDHPEDVIRYTEVVDGIEIPVVDIKTFFIGTFFATNKQQSFKGYSRNSSFEQWERSAQAISARILMTD